jgi:hypothetical protein
MVTYFITIDYVLSSNSKVLTCVIPTMERAQGLLHTLEAESDCQPLATLRVLAIIYPINVVHASTISKCNNIKIELTMNVIEGKKLSTYKFI